MPLDRYHRQMLLPQIRQTGQHRLAESRVLLVGCGALGTVAAEQLVRAGVGFLRICDRDLIETSNLQRQVLFDESDAAANLPKAVGAAKRLAAINSTVVIEPRVIDVDAGNAEAQCQDVRVIIDGTDNVETRYLLNDVAVKHGIAWVYAACVATSGRVMAIMPGVTPCLRCIFPQPPAAGELETCDTAGVLGSAAAIVASLQVIAALRLLLGEPPHSQLMTLDTWPPRLHCTETTDARQPHCPACGQRKFEFLDTARRSGGAVLCGRNTVQLRPLQNGAVVDLDRLANRLASSGRVQRSPFFVRCELNESPLTLTIFPDGRALVHGTADVAAARSVFARHVGM